MTIRAVVKGVGHYLPERVVPNSELEALVETSDEWIRSRSGIERRHFAAKGQTTADLGTRAALAALLDAGLVADDIDAIIVATSTADLTFPSAATMIQAGLGMTKGFAFDVQAVCAGFVFAMTTANALIISGQAKRVLVIGAEIFSRLMDWTDRSTCVLFGDGAGALVLEAGEGNGSTEDRGILSTDLNSDGRQKDILYVDGGSSTGTTGHRSHRQTHAGSDGAGGGNGTGSRQHFGRIDSPRFVCGQGTRADQTGRFDCHRGDWRRSGLGFRGYPLVNATDLPAKSVNIAIQERLPSHCY